MMARGKAQEGTGMSDKGGSGGTKALGTVAALAAAFGARKLITLAWRQATGKEPPTDPHDPEVGIGEALGWAILTGVTIETARLLAIRLATRRARQPGGAS
jgi:Protein of unknown function (DUF4235)